MQESLIWHGPLRYNLDPTKQHTDAELWAVLKQCGMDEVVGMMPAGLDTQIDHSGTAMSIGQRQLMGIARVLLKSSKIVLLDEVGHTRIACH